MENIDSIILTGEEAEKFLEEYMHPKYDKLGEDYSKIHISYCNDHIEVQVDDLDIADI